MRRVGSLERVQELQSECLADDIPVDELMATWTESELANYFESGGTDRPGSRVYPQIWLSSDLHAEKEHNWRAIRSFAAHPDDYLVLAGDVAANLEVLEETLRLLASRFKKVFYCPGNHEVWAARSTQPTSSEGSPSFTKLEKVRGICEKLGVSMEPELVGGEAGVWIVPLLSWYDLSLDLTKLQPALADHASGFDKFTYSDFAACQWPSSLEIPYDTMTGKYPAHVAEEMAAMNVKAIEQVNAALKAGRGDSVMSFSHFLPRKQTLPDWLDPGEDEFRPEWLENSSPSTQVMFSKVAGSHIIDRQLRELTKGVPGMGKEASVCRHIHAFGHSHRPKDFELQGVHYVSYPLGYENERIQRVVPAEPELKLVWKASGPVPPPPRRLVRYWEMVGGKEPTYERDQAFLRRARSSSNDPTSPKGGRSPSASIQSRATIQSSLIVERKGSVIEYTL